MQLHEVTMTNIISHLMTENSQMRKNKQLYLFSQDAILLVHHKLEFSGREPVYWSEVSDAVGLHFLLPIT